MVKFLGGSNVPRLLSLEKILRIFLYFLVAVIRFDKSSHSNPQDRYLVHGTASTWTRIPSITYFVYLLADFYSPNEKRITRAIVTTVNHRGVRRDEKSSWSRYSRLRYNLSLAFLSLCVLSHD